MRKVNEKTKDLIKKFESLHDGDLSVINLQPKMCPAKIWTVGYGRALVNPVTKKFLKGDADKEAAYKMWPSLTYLQADMLLEQDLGVFEEAVGKLIKSKLTDNQYGALVSFAYNVGVGNLGKSTLLKKLNINPDDKTIPSEFLKWNKARGVVLRGLTNRRQAEANLYLEK
jgi:lysozyme